MIQNPGTNHYNTLMHSANGLLAALLHNRQIRGQWKRFETWLHTLCILAASSLFFWHPSSCLLIRSRSCNHLSISFSMFATVFIFSIKSFIWQIINGHLNSFQWKLKRNSATIISYRKSSIKPPRGLFNFVHSSGGLLERGELIQRVRWKGYMR